MIYLMAQIATSSDFGVYNPQPMYRKVSYNYEEDEPLSVELDSYN